MSSEMFAMPAPPGQPPPSQPQQQTPPQQQSPGGVIHDLGYRRYTGQRFGEGPIARSLFQVGLRHVFGMGRSSKAKTLPIVLALFTLIPAIVQISIWAISKNKLPLELVRYDSYALMTSLFSSTFVAMQAPVVFARDQQSGSLALYAARPLRLAGFVMVRWASLFAAAWLFMAVPLVVMGIGELLAVSDAPRHTTQMLKSVVLVTLVAAMISTIAAVVSAWITRRGIPVVVTLAVLMFGYGLVNMTRYLLDTQGHESLAQLAGVLNPFTMYDALRVALVNPNADPVVALESSGMTAFYLLFGLALVAGGLWLLVRRFTKVASK